ncbi:MAG: porin family protein [Ginsengibacter sp.]
MKKVFMILLCGGAMGVLHAQNKEVESDPKKAKLDLLEIILGANLTTITGNTPDYTPTAGVKFGVHNHIFNFSEYVGLGLGAEYSMQGGKYKSTDYIPGGNYGTSSTTSHLNYLNFPILVRYQKQRHGFFAEAGIQPGVLLSAKNKGANTTDIKNNLKKFDVGIPVGVGYHFKNKFGAGLRITPGLLNVNKDDNLKSHNMVASLSLSHSL